MKQSRSQTNEAASVSRQSIDEREHSMNGEDTKPPRIRTAVPPSQPGGEAAGGQLPKRAPRDRRSRR